MKIIYEQQTPEEALGLYCDWIVEHLKKFEPPFEWYFLFYPIRTLLLGPTRAPWWPGWPSTWG